MSGKVIKAYARINHDFDRSSKLAFGNAQVYGSFKILEIYGFKAFCKVAQIPDNFVTRLALSYRISDNDIAEYYKKYEIKLEEFTKSELEDIARIYSLERTPRVAEIAVIVKAAYNNKELEKELLWNKTVVESITKNKKMAKELGHTLTVNTVGLEWKGWGIDSIIYSIYYLFICNVFANAGVLDDFVIEGGFSIKRNIKASKADVGSVIILLSVVGTLIISRLQEIEITCFKQIEAEHLHELKKLERTKNRLETARNENKEKATIITQLQQSIALLNKEKKEKEESFAAVISNSGEVKKLTNYNIKLQSDYNDLKLMHEVLQEDFQRALQYKRFYDEFQSMTEEEGAINTDEVEIDINALKKTRVLIFGGYDIWRRSMEQWGKDNGLNVRLIKTSDNMSLPAMNSNDLVIFNLRGTSHPAMYKAVDEIRARNAILCRTFAMDVDIVMKAAYSTYIKRWSKEG